MSLTQSFQKQADYFLKETDAAFCLEDILAEFQGQFSGLKFDPKKFSKIFLPYVFANLTLRWSRLCLEYGIDSKEIQNLFFKTILNYYADAKDLDRAAHYSEAMYSANSDPEQDPLGAIAFAFFSKIGLDASADSSGLADSLRWLAGIWEGYANHFDNEFDDFMALIKTEKQSQGSNRGKHG